MSRDLDYERMLYDVEESSKLNGFIMLNIMINLKKCSIEQLAIGLYLYRFSNILRVILSEMEQNKEISLEIPQWDYFNLDTVLTPFLTEKYNERFQKGFIELISRNLITVDKDEVIINEDNVSTHINEIIRNEYVYKKSKYVSKVIDRYPIDILNEIISEIVGELND